MMIVMIKMMMVINVRGKERFFWVSNGKRDQ